MNTLQYLYRKGCLGKLVLNNRIVMSAMSVNLQPDFINDELNPRVIDYYGERAAGGAGLIIASIAYVEEQTKATVSTLGIWDDRLIPSLSKLVQRVHTHGVKIGLHLVHGGSYAPSHLNGKQAVSASAFTNWLTGETCRELSVTEIEKIVAGFARAVNRAKEAGFDLVEYNAYSGYLIREFLSPRTNKRNDRYGGELENRLQFLKEIIDASRREVGEDYTLIVKISGDEYLPDGNTIEEAEKIAEALQNYGIDGLHVSPAGHEASLPLTQGLAPRGAFVYLAQRVKKKVDIPVITAHIGDPVLAEEVLAEEKADFIAFGRQLLADPQFPKKVCEGRFEDVRPCVRCHQGCFDKIWVGDEATCLMNPGALKGREFELHPTQERKKVMIAGGGPGGMEAARVLASRGHEVVLYDRNSQLGGQLIPCAVPPGKKDFSKAIKYYSTQLAKLNLRIVLNTEVTPQVVQTEKPQVLIVSTGAKPVIPSIPGVNGGNVCTAFDILEGRVRTGKRVAVIGGGGIGCETAYYLACQSAMTPEIMTFLMRWGKLKSELLSDLSKGCKEITILEMLPTVARDIGITRRGFLRRSLAMYDVKIITEAEVNAIIDSGVRFSKEGEMHTIPVDTVVLSVGTQSDNVLYSQFQEKVPELYILGDAREPRNAMEAIKEAAAIACQI
ncbi:MAG: FAD-dependent oxidoreductase [Deltaproteobacteria bacterium]|nr:FAD-dependent oxidoreductase [Deltaproteobacteria bacterium]